MVAAGRRAAATTYAARRAAARSPGEAFAHGTVPGRGHGRARAPAAGRRGPRLCVRGRRHHALGDRYGDGRRAATRSNGGARGRDGVARERDARRGQGHGRARAHQRRPADRIIAGGGPRATGGLPAGEALRAGAAAARDADVPHARRPRLRGRVPGRDARQDRAVRAPMAGAGRRAAIGRGRIVPAGGRRAAPRGRARPRRLRA